MQDSIIVEIAVFHYTGLTLWRTSPISCIRLTSINPLLNNPNPEKQALQNHCGKGRKWRLPSFSPFLTMFSALYRTNFIISAIIKLLFNLDKSTFLLYGNEITLSQMTNFRIIYLKEFAGDIFHYDENDRKFSKRTENKVVRGSNCSSLAISPHEEQFLLFPVFSKNLYSRHVKTRAYLGKERRYSDPGQFADWERVKSPSLVLGNPEKGMWDVVDAISPPPPPSI